MLRALRDFALFPGGTDLQVSEGGPRMKSAVTVGYETDAKSLSKLLVEKEEGRAKFVSGKTDWPRALWKKHMLHSGDSLAAWSRTMWEPVFSE